MTKLRMNNCIFAGIDPDLHTTGLAFIADHLGREPYLIYACRVKATKNKQHQAVIDMAKALRDHFLDKEYVPSKCTGFAVEAQEMYLGKTRDPRSIMLLGNAAGCALQEMIGQYPAAYGRFPRPAEWKGQVPKHVKQKRGFDKLGIDCQIKGNMTKDSAYYVPTRLTGMEHAHIESMSYGDWKHVGDAVGLALWVREEYYHMIDQRELRANRA